MWGCEEDGPKKHKHILSNGISEWNREWTVKKNGKRTKQSTFARMEISDGTVRNGLSSPVVLIFARATVEIPPIQMLITSAASPFHFQMIVQIDAHDVARRKNIQSCMSLEYDPWPCHDGQ